MYLLGEKLDGVESIVVGPIHFLGAMRGFNGYSIQFNVIPIF